MTGHESATKVLESGDIKCYCRTLVHGPALVFLLHTGLFFIVIIEAVLAFPQCAQLSPVHTSKVKAIRLTGGYLL